MASSMNLKQLMSAKSRSWFHVIQDQLIVSGEVNTINAADFVRQLARLYENMEPRLEGSFVYKHRDVFIAANFVNPTKYEVKAAKDEFVVSGGAELGKTAYIRCGR
ncbi:MAG: hypothetical protein M1835_001405 [Candelina submexicana]|nr:MAG: hypothetical protein M1835_001405 [Candelina submexicana]